MGLGYTKRQHGRDAMALVLISTANRRGLVRWIRQDGPCGKDVLEHLFTLISRSSIGLSNAEASGSEVEIAAARREFGKVRALAKHVARRCGR